MSDLISRQAAIDALEREKTYCTAYKDGYTKTDVFKQYNMGLTDGIKALNKLPSVDAVPVVRCGNCAKRGKNGKGISGGCPFGMTDDTCDPNAYCSYGVLSMKTGESL